MHDGNRRTHGERAGEFFPPDPPLLIAELKGNRERAE